MNRRQRDSNRANAERLRLMAHFCENCGERGGHWVQTGPQSLDDIFAGRPDSGFWTCNKYYGPDGRRLPEHIDPAWGGGLGAFVAAMHEFGLMNPPAATPKQTGPNEPESRGRVA